MQLFYLCISILDTTGTCTTQGLVLAQHQKFTLLPTECPEVSVVPDLEFITVALEGASISSSPKLSVLCYSGSLMKPWGDMNPSRVLVDYQISAGPRATAFCPLSPLVRLVSSGAGSDCPAHPPVCSQE